MAPPIRKMICLRKMICFMVSPQGLRRPVARARHITVTALRIMIMRPFME
jgi:hypothetical protein